MKTLKVTQTDIDKAFAKRDAIVTKLDEIGKTIDRDDRFFSVRRNNDFYIEDAEFIDGLVWKTKGKHSQFYYSTWRDYPHYNGDNKGKTKDECYQLSETEKILHSTKDFRISWVRLGNHERTDIYWGWRMFEPEFALIDNKTNEIVFKSEKEWEFKLTALGLIKPQVPNDLYSKLAIGNPFKIKIVPFTDTDLIKRCNELQGNSYWQFDHYFKNPEFNREGIYVVFFLGYRSDYGSKATWFFMESETVPTFDEALLQAVEVIKKYNHSDLTDLLMSFKSNKIDLNEVNLGQEERFRYLVSEKFSRKLCKILGVTNVKSLYEKFQK